MELKQGFAEGYRESQSHCKMKKALQVAESVLQKRVSTMSNNNGSSTSLRLKTGLAEMLKGGVIMDVTNAEQASIAEKAGAVAVMATDGCRFGAVAGASDFTEVSFRAAIGQSPAASLEFERRTAALR